MPPRTDFRRARAAALALAGFCALASAPASAQSLPAELKALLARMPADSLPGPLRRFEGEHARASEAAEAVLVLGQLHYARGEYRRAAVTFARAAARLDPARKPEARYWAGLAWLALGDANQARAALDEVAAARGPRRSEAMLAQAQAWELAQRPARAGETLAALLGGDPGEVGPAALERAAALAERDGEEDQARTFRERLLREYPRSMEAAAARPAVFAASARTRPARPGAVAVVIGSFAELSRARSLASAARAAGFADAQVVSRGQGLVAVHTVRLGVYPRPADARKAGEQAERALGVSFELMRAR